MTMRERHADAQDRARRLYLRRQDIEAQRQQLAQQAQAVDLALVRTDGELAVLDALIAEEASRGE